MDNLFRENYPDEFQMNCDEIFRLLFENESDENRSNYIKSAKKDVWDIIFNTCCDVRAIEKELLEKKYEELKVMYFISKVEENKNKLLYFSLLKHNSKYGEALSAFNWTLKFVCGTSELKTLKYPILQLSLNTFLNNDKNQKLYEMDKNMLGKLIETIENIT